MMKECMKTKVWNFDLPPYPREGISLLEMSDYCQVNRLISFEAGNLARLHQLDEIRDMASLRQFQSRLRSRLWKVFGCRYDHALPLAVREFGKIRRDGFTVTKLIYQGRPGIFVTALLFVPEGKGTFPAVLLMHGHNPTGKFAETQQHLAISLAQNGFVCLSVDAFGTYERGQNAYTAEYHGRCLGASLFNIGETLMGAQVVDNMRGVDLLQSLPFVQKNKIGAAGASGGGNQTMWVSAMDRRIAAAMPIVSVGSFESYARGVNCVCELLPDGLTLTEEAGILALIAPRYLRIGNAYYDANHDFSVGEMLKTYHPVERLYRNLGCAENLSCHIADKVHGLWLSQRESALGFFTYALKGQGIGSPMPEPEHEIIPEQELHLFKDPAERTVHQVRSIQEHCRMAGEILRRNYLSGQTISARSAKKELKKILRLHDIPAVRLYRYNDINGTGRAALEAGNHLIPFLIRYGTAAGKYRIVLHPQGKGALDGATLDQAAADGATLILPDLFGAGETAQPTHIAGMYHQFFRQLLWLGRSLAGEWTYDLLALVKSLKHDFKAEKIEVTGLLETGFTALCANVFSDSIDHVEAVNSPGSLLFDARTISFQADPLNPFLPGAIYSMALSLPGFLKWGDVSLVAALGAGKVTLISPRTSDGTPYTAPEQKRLTGEINSVCKRLK